MLEQKKETVSVERVRTIAVVCDVCKMRIERASGDESIDWVPPYQIDETAIFRKTGSSYPEGGATRTECYHICPKCYEEKLAPFLRELAGEPNVIEQDW